MKMGAAMNGGGKPKDKGGEFYPTPAEAVTAVLPYLDDFPREVWEPACGEGDISKVLEADGFDVFSSDLWDRGYGVTGIDFLSVQNIDIGTPIITNPPFSLAARFIEHAINVEFCAYLLKATFWNAARRLPLFNARLPSAIHPLTWRLDFNGKGAPVMDCAWVIYRPGATRTDFEPIRKPTA
jgi:hypothetical protein